MILWLATPIEPPSWPPPLFGLAIATLWGSFAASQIYRYRRLSTSTQRQQTKWVVFGIALAVVGFLATVALEGAPSAME